MPACASGRARSLYDQSVLVCLVCSAEETRFQSTSVEAHVPDFGYVIVGGVKIAKQILKEVDSL